MTSSSSSQSPRSSQFGPDAKEARYARCAGPYNAESVGKRYIDAKKALGIENLRFNDSRREAAYRQYKAGFAPHEIARATGHDVQKVVEMCEDFAQEEQPGRGPNKEPDARLGG